MERRFQKQVGIVAGAARGIGKAIAHRLILEGASILLLDNQADLLEQTKHELAQYGSVNSVVADLTDVTSVQSTLLDLYQQQQRLDLVVNCVGIVGATSVPIADYDLDLFRKVLDVNLTSAFILTKESIPYMLKRNYGRILHLASIGGKEGNPGMVGYAASKSGLMGLVKGVGKEYATTGITINGLAPAVIATEFNENTDPDMLQYMVDKIPMKRLGTVEEVAALSCWLVSEEASFNTASIFDLSGGRATY